MNTTPYTFIFAGRSGCGKGTQLKLLQRYLSEKDPGTTQFAFATGDAFRALFGTGSYTAELAQEVTNRGGLQPLFLTIAMWGNAFVQNVTPETQIFIDGYPRVLEEAIAVDSALSFYKRPKPIVLNFVVSRESSKARMLGRGRADDTVENIEERLNWYDTKVTPAIEYFRGRNEYIFWDIDGEKSIEEIHADIINRLNTL